MKTRMKKVGATEFKTHCLELIAEVQKKRQPVLITKRGKAAAKLVPADEKGDCDFFDALKGKVEIVGDIVSPFPPEDWGDLAWDE